MTNIICPVCGKALEKDNRSYKCENRHSFDEAKEGYVNLLVSSKAGSLIGDNKDMAKSRRDFLSKGYFSALSDEIVKIIGESRKLNPLICDICCGEGWYGDYIKSRFPCCMVGFDISKEMIRLAAKRHNGSTYFVANLSKIPLQSQSVDIAFHLFAPFHEKEFSRIIKKDGLIITAVAGEDHLFELKEILYDTPYKNDEEPPKAETLKLKEKRKVKKKIHLSGKEDIDALFRMTPYYYHTSEKDKAKLELYTELDVTVEFVIYIYGKTDC
ncbi:MAG: methyltransferase domain-containing protein [Clostridia bacterium]|nr:methyltransferase domain-containing protein [Clostridia bacterium]